MSCLMLFAQAGESAKIVQEIYVSLCSKERLVVVLAMEIHEKIADGLQHRERHRRVIDKAPVVAFGGDLPPEDQIAVDFEILTTKYRLDLLVPGDSEDRLDDRFIRALSDNVRIRTLPKNQAEGIDEYRFPGTCLTGDDIQPALEFNLHLFDEGVIPDKKGLEHVDFLNETKCTQKKGNFNAAGGTAAKYRAHRGRARVEIRLLDRRRRRGRNLEEIEIGHVRENPVVEGNLDVL